jgi:hypothetical protein
MMKGSGSGRPNKVGFTTQADNGTLHKSKYSRPVLTYSVGAYDKILYTSVADPDPAFHFDADPDPSFHPDAGTRL